MNLKENEYSLLNLLTKSQKIRNNLTYFDSRSRKFWMYAAFFICSRRTTEGLVKKVLDRSSLKAPVFSNFFLNLFKARSMDSLSFMLITIISFYLLKGAQI